MKLLSPLDQMFARMETSRTPMHIGALAIFELPDGAAPSFVRDLYEAFAQMAYLPFPFDSVLAGGSAMAYWKQVEPDPSYHIRHEAVPQPGTNRDLGALVERLHSTPLDMTKPLWEAHIIEGLANNRFAFYFKAHHCATDGMGAMNYIQRWLTTDPTAPPGSGRPATDDVDEGFDLANLFAVTAAKRVIESFSAASELVPKLAGMMFGENSTVQAALNTPRTPFNARVTQHRRLAVEILSLPRLKAVGAATGATVNDVVLAAIGGGSRRYLTELEALPETTLTASVPVGLERDADTINAAAGFVTPLGTSIEDPVERLREIAAATRRAKGELQSMSTNALEHYSLFGLLPIALGQKSGAPAVIPPLFNFTVSNVVLSKQPLYLFGAKLEIIVPISFLCDGYGLNVTLVGYVDRVALGFVGCRDTLPRLQRLARYTADAFEELEAATAVG